MRRGNLLRNYADVFAVLMRLRQLCCHRELLPVDWNTVDMNELMALAAENTPKGLDPGPGEIDQTSGLSVELVKHRAEQLCQMIKDGISDECSIW
jgi:hypothetical protein